jgi:hypothetical protein
MREMPVARSDPAGFAFSCEDAKLSISASTWNTRLSQLARMNGPLLIMTRLLPNLDYIARIVGKRPVDICILANSEAEADARQLKARFPAIRIALHPNINAKVVLLAPDTVWVGSADFGESKEVESAIGLHSKAAHERAVSSLFIPYMGERARDLIEQLGADLRGVISQCSASRIQRWVDHRQDSRFALSRAPTAARLPCLRLLRQMFVGLSPKGTLVSDFSALFALTHPNSHEGGLSQTLMAMIRRTDVVAEQPRQRTEVQRRKVPALFVFAHQA